jgi:hypothetical protein
MELLFHTGRDIMVLDLPLDDFESLPGLLLLSRELKLRKKLLIEATHSDAKLQATISHTDMLPLLFIPTISQEVEKTL